MRVDRPQSRWPRFIGALAFALALLLGPGSAGAADDPLTQVQNGVQDVERLLHQWQFTKARVLAEGLLQAHPDLPAVQFAAGWVKFHLGEHRAAQELVDRAVAAFGGQLERDGRVAMVRAMARISAKFERQESSDGRVVVYHSPGLDQVLVPDLIATVERTLDVVGQDLGHQPDHPIVVQVLPDADALADATGLTAEEIKTSGTIAVCKFGRLMVTSPRNTLKGYSYLDTASHELVHLLISQKTFNRTPIWIHEALAKYEDSRWRSGEELYRKGLPPLRQSTLARAMRTGELITFEQMHPSMALLPSAQAAELAFSEVYTVSAFLLSRKGYDGLRSLLAELAEGRDDMDAIRSVYGYTRPQFVAAWLAWLAQQRLVELRGESDLDGAAKDRGKSGGEKALARNTQLELRDHFHLGQLFRARGRTRAAVVEYGQARKKAGRDHAALWIIADKLGQVLAAVGRLAEAREAFETSLDIHHEDLEAHYHLGRLLRAEHPYLAYLHLREAVRLNPLDPRVQRLMVTTCQRLAEEGNTSEDFSALARWHSLVLRLLRNHGRSAPSEPGPQAKQPSAGDSASIRIVSRPWARVWLDFEDTGLTTPVYRLAVPPGRHVISLVAKCQKDPEVIQLNLRAGQNELIDRQLCPENGSSPNEGDRAGNPLAE